MLTLEKLAAIIKDVKKMDTSFSLEMALVYFNGCESYDKKMGHSYLDASSNNLPNYEIWCYAFASSYYAGNCKEKVDDSEEGGKANKDIGPPFANKFFEFCDNDYWANNREGIQDVKFAHETARNPNNWDNAKKTMLTTMNPQIFKSTRDSGYTYIDCNYKGILPTPSPSNTPSGGNP